MTFQASTGGHFKTRRNGSRVYHILRSFIALWLGALAAASAAAQTPTIGSKAPDFTLSTPTGSSVRLAAETAKGTTVLVVLRGFPGYQCPYCEKQVHDFIGHSSDFAARKAHVLFVYPGPPAELDPHAKEFLAKQANLPKNMELVTDPDYKMTSLYGLRWDARPTRRRILPHSSWTGTVRSCLKRLVAAMAIGHQPRTS